MIAEIIFQDIDILSHPSLRGSAVTQVIKGDNTQRQTDRGIDFMTTVDHQ